MSNIKFSLGMIEAILQDENLEKIKILQEKQLPAKLRYYFNKGIDILQKERIKISEVKNKIFEQYGDKDEKGELIKSDLGGGRFIPKITGENLIKTQEELESLMSSEIDLGFKKIKIDSMKLPDLTGFEAELLAQFYIDIDDNIDDDRKSEKQNKTE